MFRPSRVFVAAVSLAAAACNDTNGNFVHTVNFALVRFVNATDTPITVVNNGVINTNNASLVFGRQSACVAVDLTDGATVTFTNSVTGALITVSTSTLTIGGNFTVVAFIDTNGVMQFATVSNRFTPTAGHAGLRFFNAATASGPLTMLGNGIALSPPTPLGSASAFVNVPPVTETITFTNDTTVLNAGAMTFTAGQSSTIVVGPAAAGTTTLRFFTTTGC